MASKEEEPLLTPATGDFSDVPDLPLTQLFSTVPLSQVISVLPRVCPTWGSLSRRHLSTKHHLVLYIGAHIDAFLRQSAFSCSSAVPLSQHLRSSDGRLPLPSFDTLSNRLNLPSLETSTVEQLICLMPNIAFLHLIMHKPPPEVNDQIVRLLDAWAGQLKSLKIMSSRYDETGITLLPDKYYLKVQAIRAPLRRLLQSINRLPVLEILTLDLGEIPGGQIDLPILGRLTEFHFINRVHPCLQQIVESLHRYAAGNDPLTTIGLSVGGGVELTLEYFANTPLAPKITYFPRNVALDSDNLARYLGAFPRLQTIDISSLNRDHCQSDQLYLLWLSRTFATSLPLPNLTHLAITFNWFNTGDRLWVADQSTDDTLLSLPAVKVLTITLESVITRIDRQVGGISNGVDHSGLDCPLWGHIFPSLQIILLDPTYNQDCHLCNGTVDMEDGDAFYYEEEEEYENYYCFSKAWEESLEAEEPSADPSSRPPSPSGENLEPRVEACLKKLLRPFKAQCSQLRKIYIKTNKQGNVWGTLEMTDQEL